MFHYTLSHPENDRDVTESAQEYTLQDASFIRQSRCSVFRHGRSWGETKYRTQPVMCLSCTDEHALHYAGSRTLYTRPMGEL